jgi:hypothetical protein
MSLAWSRDELSKGLQDLLTHVAGRQVRVFLLTPTQYGASSAPAKQALTGDPVVAQKPHGLVVGAADHLVDPFHDLLRAHGFGGVQSAIDPNHCLTVAGECASLSLVKAFRVSEPLRDITIAREVAVILRWGRLVGDTPALQTQFGQPGNQRPGCGFPVAHLLTLFHAGTGFLLQVLAAGVQRVRRQRAVGRRPKGRSP